MGAERPSGAMPCFSPSSSGMSGGSRALACNLWHNCVRSGMRVSSSIGNASSSSSCQGARRKERAMSEVHLQCIQIWALGVPGELYSLPQQENTFAQRAHHTHDLRTAIEVIGHAND